MFKNKNNQIRSGWFIFVAFILMVILNGLFSYPGIYFFLKEVVVHDQSELYHMLEGYPWYNLFVNGGAVLGTIVSVIVAWRFLNKKKIIELGFGKGFKKFGFGLILGGLSITFIFMILLLTKQITLENDLITPHFSTFTMTYLLFFIIVGFAEELFFRGYVMQTMRQTGNHKWVIYIVSALIFSGAHGANPNVSILGLLNIFLVGLLFAYMFDKSNSLWMPIGYHITWNYFQGSVFGFAVSGTEPYGLYDVKLNSSHDFLTGGTFGLEGGLLATLMIIVGFFITYIYSKK